LGRIFLAYKLNPLIFTLLSFKNNSNLIDLNVKETTHKTSARLTTEGRRFFVQANQVSVEIKPNFVSALIQEGRYVVLKALHSQWPNPGSVGSA